MIAYAIDNLLVKVYNNVMRGVCGVLGYSQQTKERWFIKYDI